MGNRVQPSLPDPRRRQNRRSGRSTSRPPGAGTPAFDTPRSGRPRSPPSTGNHPPRRPNRPDSSHKRTQSPASNRAGRSQRPTPKSHHHRFDHQVPQVPTESTNPWFPKRTHRHQNGHAIPSPAYPHAHHRNSRTANTHRQTGRNRRPPAARPTRDRPHHRRTNLHRLVPPRPIPQRSRLRSPGRRSPPPSLLRTTNPPPTKPTR